MRSDWRKWMEATKKEMAGWDDNDAYELVDTAVMNSGDPLVTLGELYTIKRDGRYKFRQICHGNFLSKDAGDYKDTFSTTVSADGLRWFTSLACACNKRIKGWDATCGYLQTEHLSLLSRHAHAWSKRHFDGLLKVLEYGYTTREIGLIYSADLDEHGVNTLYAYADSAFTAPRSQGAESKLKG